MNVLEYHIVEIHSVNPYRAEWTKEVPGKKFVTADITTNCYGSIKRESRVFTQTEWDEVVRKGYYLG
ncbi:hypothetical protein [Bacillus phage phiAGATE]|uniref:Uncharacterized protein n=1 Tax=Bacillus phage phiAGATE TaxID=1204533 RepID=L0LBZ0_9CAUD|nr:hypothetical protein G380_gp030 [Bacillus phage phiAGATE]AGB62680.1 hypothetical protein [Bacillus phage phiAGATE]